MRVCRNCGLVNQFPAPAPGEPAPSVMCGSCGHVTHAPRRATADPAGTAALLQQSAEEAVYADPRTGRQISGPVVRVNVGGQRRLVPLAVLQQLMREQHGNPAHGADIGALPTRTLQGAEHLGEQTNCLICLEDFGDGDDVMTLPCLHIYHKKCVEQWLGRDNSCPVCKTPIGGNPSG